jgi:tripartite-type tricarboxylate transporter receptor subunit TctC
LFKLTFNLDLAMVPFPGAAPAITSTIGGHTPIAFTALPPAITAAKENKVRALAVMAEQRVSALPDVPTMAEAGVADQEADTLTGIVAPAGTPKEIVDQLQRDIAKIVAQPTSRRSSTHSASGRSPTRRRSSPRRSRPRWKSVGKVVRAAKLKIE